MVNESQRDPEPGTNRASESAPAPQDLGTEPSEAGEPATSDGFTVAESARLLAMKAQGVEQREGSGKLHPIPGIAPKRYFRREVLDAHEELVRKHRTKLEDLRQAAADFRIGDVAIEVDGSEEWEPSQLRSSSDGLRVGGANLATLLDIVRSEQASRAVAEARLDEARDALRSEQIGRAVAEAKIEELKAHLRRARKALSDLSVDPDGSLDIPEK